MKYDFDLIVFDANVLVADPGLTSVGYEYLRAFARDRGTRILVPDVVLREVKVHLARDVDAIQSQVNDIRARGPRLGILELRGLPVGTDHWRKTALSHLESRLRWLGAESIPLPRVEHREVLDRIEAGIRPFHAERKSDAGYKDFLVWKSLVTMGTVDVHEARQHAAFLSNNVDDFGAAEDKALLHSTLIAEARAHGLEVSYFRSIQEFARVIRDLLPLASVAEVHLRPPEVMAALAEWVFDKVDHYQLEQEIDASQFDSQLREVAYAESGYGSWVADAVLTDIEIEVVSDVRLTGPDRVRELDGDRVVAEFGSVWTVALAGEWRAGDRTSRTRLRTSLTVPVAFAVRMGAAAEPEGAVTFWPADVSGADE